MKKTMEVCGYTFSFLQEIEPKQIEAGSIFEYAPQSEYANKDSEKLNQNGSGTFCKFKLNTEEKAGVYLWVLEGKIIYLGKTGNLRERFNSGYGTISPKNCYEGGQSTNCKMNKVALETAKAGKRIAIYFLETDKYNQIEKELLGKIDTPYNTQDN